MPRWVNVPNSFTLLRLFLIPLVIVAIVDGNHLRALVLFACAALTDIMDGAAARHFQRTTQVGAYLDPIADKGLLSGVFLALAAASLVPVWFVAVVFGRDLYILFAAALLLRFTSLRNFAPSIWGKASTFVQIVTAVTVMARNAFSFQVLDTLSSAILWPCAAFTLWSGIHYTWRGVQLARAH
jgi:cardiolipin synthase